MVNQFKPTVAMFGGSFDPPHQGHQQIVEAIIKALDIDLLLVVPAYLNPFKHTSLASPMQRLHWCQTLFTEVDGVSVEAYEIMQHKSTTTAHTIKHFNNKYDVKYLIIGADNVSTLDKWHQFAWLNAHIIWVIVTRAGYPIETEGLRAWKIITLKAPISSSHIRDTKALHYVDKSIQKSVQNVLQGQSLMTIEERVSTIVDILDDKKADEIEVFNLEDADYIAKRVIIANSLNGKHTLALADHLKKGLKAQGDAILASDMSDDWVVLDLGDMLIHIMVPEYRQRYSLEQFLLELVEKQQKENSDPA